MWKFQDYFKGEARSLLNVELRALGLLAVIGECRATSFDILQPLKVNEVSQNTGTVPLRNVGIWSFEKKRMYRVHLEDQIPSF